MNTNIGLLDRIIRVLVGLSIYALLLLNVISGIFALGLVALGTIFY